MNEPKKHLAEIDGNIYYLSRQYDEHGTFLGEDWVKAEEFESVEEAQEYLLNYEQNTETRGA